MTTFYSYDYNILAKKFEDFGMNRFSKYYFTNKDNENYNLDFDFAKINKYTLKDIADILNISCQEVLINLIKWQKKVVISCLISCLYEKNRI